MESRNAEFSITETETETRNKSIVETLYKALAENNGTSVTNLVASDLDYWFHGPPHCQHMMRVLTGQTSEFRFEPRSVEVIGDCVIVEGWEGAQAYWVHVWILKHGLITEFKEYFNTWLTVTDLRKSTTSGWEIVSLHRQTLWQSQPRDLARRSLPGLLLAI